MNSDRRSVISAIGAAGFTFLIPSISVAAQTIRTRHSVDTVPGRAMLAKYAEAVRRMNDPALNPRVNPRSWRYQWYIHAIPTDKETELTKVFGASPSPARDLAATVWETCQAHSPGADPDMFLPWHRMYLLAFEQVVRAVLDDQDFTLPYWDYTVPGNRSIPALLRLPTGALYRANRNRGRANINAGDPMDKGSSGNAYSRDAMSRSSYGGPTGFCSTLDRGLHGNVHVGIGDPTNMGQVPTAAGDPVFWLHHCNIDRLWAGWNKAGGVNTFGAAKFSFATPDPAGGRIDMDTSAVGDTTSLGYQYDSLPTPAPVVISGATAGGEPRTIATSEMGIRLGSRTRIPLRAASPDGVITGSVASAAASGRVYLVLSGLAAKVEPGTLYDAFVDLPERASAAQKREHYLGTFSFFGSVGEHMHHGGGPSFEVTEAFRRLAARGLLKAETAITVVPVSPAANGSEPVVGAVELQRR